MSSPINTKEICQKALGLVSQLQGRPGNVTKYATFEFDASSKDEAEFMANALLTASNVDFFNDLVMLLKQSPEIRIKAYGFIYDPDKTPSVSISVPTHGASSWTVFAQRMCQAIRDVETNLNRHPAPPLNSTLTAGMSISPPEVNMPAGMPIVVSPFMTNPVAIPYSTPKPNPGHVPPSASKKGVWESASPPPLPQESAHPVEPAPEQLEKSTPAAMNEPPPAPKEITPEEREQRRLALQRKQETAAENEKRLLEERQARQREKAAQEQAKSRQQQGDVAAREREKAQDPWPADISHLKKGLENLEKHRDKHYVGQSAIIAHAIRALSEALDTRDDEALGMTRLKGIPLTEKKKETEMHRRLAEILLSEDAVYMALEAVGRGMGKDFDSQQKYTGSMSAKEKGDYEDAINANRQYLRDHPEARGFLSDQSAEIPGLVFLTQAATIMRDDMDKAASPLWKNLRKPSDASRILKSQLDFFQNDCQNLLDKCAKASSHRK